MVITDGTNRPQGHENQTPNCRICQDGQRQFDLSEPNLYFLEKRLAEGNLNSALDLARAAWDQFPSLKESADTKRMAEFLMEGLEDKINTQVLLPISSTTAAMTTVIDRLKDLADKNPALIEQGFSRTLDGFRSEMNVIKAAIQEPTTKISELSQMVNQLIYKPIVKGIAGEAVLADTWIEHFSKDQVVKLGGSGREDILVTPHLDNGAARYGERIIVERKAGKQKYNGSHRQEAIQHAKEKGASFALLVYDNQDNLPLTVKPVTVSREQGVLLAISDLQSGSWKMMRETIEIMQQVMQGSNKDITAIDVDAIQEVVTELGNMVKLVEQIKGNNAKIRSCSDEVEQSVLAIKALVKSYQGKLQVAVTGDVNKANSAEPRSLTGVADAK